MQHVHGAGVLHRDIKPANLLLMDPLPAAGDGEAVPRVQIADFGLAVQLQEDGVSGGAGGGYDAQSIRNTGKPTGGFYRRQMVRAGADGAPVTVYWYEGAGRRCCRL